MITACQHEGGLAEAAHNALQHKGLVLLQRLPPVVCRAINTPQTDPSRLDANECSLTEFCCLEGESELQHLDLSRNSIAAALPCHTRYLSGLTHLCLSHNVVVDVSGCACLPALKVLLLGNNQLASCSLQPLTALRQLSVLDVHHNRLTSLTALAGLSSLAVVNAAANKLQQLPCLTALTALTELNLRRNHLTSLMPAAAATALPASLVRLSVAHNKLPQTGALLPLRQLPGLADLCVDGNPFDSMTARNCSSRDDVLACCPPSLIMLDSQTVSPSERVLILTTAATLSAAQRRSSGIAAAEGDFMPYSAAPGELAVRTRQAKQHAGNGSAVPAASQAASQQRCDPLQLRYRTPQQQQVCSDGSCSNGWVQPHLNSMQQEAPQHQQLTQDFRLLSVRQQTPSRCGAAAAVGAAGAAVSIDTASGDQRRSPTSSLPSRQASSYTAPDDAAAAAAAAAAPDVLRRSSIADKLRPHSAGDVLNLASLAAAQAAAPGTGWGGTTAGSLLGAGRPRAYSSSSSSSLLRERHARRGPHSLTAAAAFAEARADPATCPADIQAAIPQSNTIAQASESAAEATVSCRSQGEEPNGGKGNDNAAEQHATETACGTLAPAATCQQAATLAPAAAAAPAAPAGPAAVRYEGALALAAVACGLTLPDNHSAAFTTQQQALTDTVTREVKAAGDWGVYVYGAGSDPTAAAAGGVAVISTEELEEKYLTAKQATLADRHRQSQQRAVSPTSRPAEPGVLLRGGRVVLTGHAALGALSGQALAHVADVTLEHMAYSKVLAALPLLCGLSHLSTLSLGHLSGLSVLPQLHPLMQLSRLRHLTVHGCTLARLVLLRPYVAFRLSGLQSLNGVPISQSEVVAAAELFGPLEAALAVALAQTPQQAALAASGIMQGKSSLLQQPASSSNSSSSTAAAPAATVWSAGSSMGLQHIAGHNHSCSTATAAATTDFHPAVPALLQTAQEQRQHASACALTLHDSLADAGRGSTVHASGAVALVGSSVAPNLGQARCVFASMAGPLLPPAGCMSKGAAFAAELLSEAADVQQQLAVLHDQAWPGLLERSMHEGWSGHYSHSSTAEEQL